jgi:chemosensory pili system protein ChpA (sensor histidine kinase/response regulator)
MKRILVVDDYPMTREPLARLLRYEGYQVDCAANGIEAIEAMHQHVPDLMLLDVVMPRMNGLTLLEEIRLDPRLRDLPVIAITGSQDSAQMASVRALKVRAVLHKSRFTLDELFTQISHCLPLGTA